MKSNDKIPRDEMLLAEAVAAAKGRNLSLSIHAYFRKNGIECRATDADSCCIIGALCLAGRLESEEFEGKTLPLNRFRFNGAAFGNDRPDLDWRFPNDRDGEDLGWAFRCAMEPDR